MGSRYRRAPTVRSRTVLGLGSPTVVVRRCLDELTDVPTDGERASGDVQRERRPDVLVDEDPEGLRDRSHSIWGRSSAPRLGVPTSAVEGSARWWPWRSGRRVEPDDGRRARPRHRSRRCPAPPHPQPSLPLLPQPSLPPRPLPERPPLPTTGPSRLTAIRSPTGLPRAATTARHPTRSVPSSSATAGTPLGVDGRPRGPCGRRTGTACCTSGSAGVRASWRLVPAAWPMWPCVTSRTRSTSPCSLDGHARRRPDRRRRRRVGPTGRGRGTPRHLGHRPAGPCSRPSPGALRRWASCACSPTRSLSSPPPWVLMGTSSHRRRSSR